MSGIVPLVAVERISVRRGPDRAVTEADGRRTEHSFSFGAHYDPDNVGFGLLVAHNDEHLPTGGGYPDHPHRDTEIVTVVLDGVLRHRSATGGTVDLGAGCVQRLSAGSGVVHAETAANGPVRFVQTWLRPSAVGATPSYAHSQPPIGDGLVPLVGGDGVLGVGAAAQLYDVRLNAGAPVTLPAAPRLHLFVTSGTLDLETARLAAGDAAQLSDAGGVIASAPAAATALLWSLG